MAFLQAAANRQSGGYNINNSLKLETTNNEWLIRQSPTAGNGKTHTFSFWIKRSTLGNPTASGTMYVIGQGQHGRMFFSSDFFQYRFDDGHDVRDVTTKHRDPAAWLHVVVAVDTNQSSSTNRVKIFYNGVQTTTLDYDGGSQPDQEDSASGWFTSNYLTIGTAPFGGSYNAGDGDYDMSGYLAEFAAVEGTAYAATDFGEYDDNGIWVPKDLGGITWGNEGFYLPFSNASALGEDASGNDNDFTLSNIAAADQATDTPTNNFCTLNPLNRNSATTSNNPSYTDGNTKTIMSLNGYWQTAIGSIGVTSGKWYMEGQLIYNPQMAGIGVGDFGDIENWGRNNDWIGASKAVAYGTPKAEVGDSLPSSANDYTNSHIIGVALDADNGKVYWSRDGTYQSSGDPAGNSSGIALPTGGTAIGLYMFGVSGYKATHGSYPGTVGWLVNFGGFTNISISSAATDANGYGTFEYAPPSGFYALCTKNLAKYGG